MKKQILAVLLTLVFAGTFMACGGSREGAETETAADQSISDFSVAEPTTAPPVSSSAARVTVQPTVTPSIPADESTAAAAASGIITPIPPVEANGTVQPAGTVPADGTNAVNGTVAPNGTTAPDGTVAPADGTAANTAAAPDSPQNMIVSTEINVRDGASLDAGILGGFDEGDEITVLGKEGDWYIVEYEGQTGYVNSQYVNPAGASSDTGSSAGSGSGSSDYGRLVDGQGDPVNLDYWNGEYEIYDENGNDVTQEVLNNR